MPAVNFGDNPLLSKQPSKAKPTTAPEEPGVKVTDAYFGGKDIRISNRHIVLTTLTKCLNFSRSVTCFDVNFIAKLLLVCSGRVAYVINLESNILKMEAGKTGGGIHRGDIRSCCFDSKGELAATAADDKRIIIWDISKGKSVRVIDGGHKGIIYQLSFSQESDKLYTSSDDGQVFVWNWKTAKVINPCMKHASSVRTFDFLRSHPEIVVCGRNDGAVSVWNIEELLKIDEISPEPTYFVKEDEAVAPIHERYHTSSITCIKLSYDRKLMATASTDNTAKIWKVNSYQKDLAEVRLAEKQSEIAKSRLNGYIDVLDESLDENIDDPEFNGLKLDEVPINPGYCADLKFTFVHEAPVMCLGFTTNSDILVTGSLDATCRIWSSRRGEPLFQINLPAPVTDLRVMNDERFLVCTGSRVLEFKIKPLFKEADLPNYWKEAGIKKALDAPPPRKTTIVREQPLYNPNPKTPIVVSELKQLMAHGVVLPDTIADITDEFPDINMNELQQNMKKYKVNTQQVLRLIANNRYAPKDILEALSLKDSAKIMFALINQGANIHTLMARLGYSKLESKEDPILMMNLKNLVDPRDVETPGNNRHFDYKKWWNEHFPESKVEDDEEEEESDNEYDMFNAVQRDFVQQRGKIVHFIPSSHMKMIKDIRSDKAVKPIFLRSLVTTQMDGQRFPNFSTEDEYAQETFNVSQLSQRGTIVQKTARFNEDVSGYVIRNARRYANTPDDVYKKIKNIRKNKQGLVKFNPNALVRRDAGYWNGSQGDINGYAIELTSSFIQTRGLSISYGEPSKGSKPKVEEEKDTDIDRIAEMIFSMPIVVGETKNERYSVQVGPKKSFKDYIFDMPKFKEFKDKQ